LDASARVELRAKPRPEGASSRSESFARVASETRSADALTRAGIRLDDVPNPPIEFRGTSAEWRIRFTSPLTPSQVGRLLKDMLSLVPRERLALLARLRLTDDPTVVAEVLSVVDRVPDDSGVLIELARVLARWAGRPRLADAAVNPPPADAATLRGVAVATLARAVRRRGARLTADTWTGIRRTLDELGEGAPDAGDAPDAGAADLREEVRSVIESAANDPESYRAGIGPFAIAGSIGDEAVVVAVIRALERWASLHQSFINPSDDDSPIDLAALRSLATSAIARGSKEQRSRVTSVLLAMDPPADSARWREYVALIWDLGRDHRVAAEDQNAFRQLAQRLGGGTR
jgi:hypothetical protein